MNRLFNISSMNWVSRTAAVGLLTMSVLAADPAPDFYYGVGTHFGMSRHSEKQLFSAIEQAGLNSIRDDVVWRSLERGDRGNYDKRYSDLVLGNPLRKGVVPLPVLAYGNILYGGNGTYPHDQEALDAYAKYCEFVVSSFKGRIPVYEIWNEWGANPDPKSGPSTANDYAKLLAYVIPRLRKIDPDAKFIAGWRDEQSMPSLSGSYPRWIENFLEAGCLEHLDGYSSHPYGYRDTDRRYPEDLQQRLGALESLLKKYNDGKEVPIYVTELGWPTNTGKWGITPSGQTDLISRAYLIARSIPYVRGLWIYNMQDDGYNPEYNENNFGLLRPDGTPKPGYWGMAETVGVLKDLTFVRRRPVDKVEDLWLLEFKTKENEPVWAAWSSNRMYQYQVVFESDELRPQESLGITPIGRPSFTLPFGYREWVDVKNKRTLQNKVNTNQVSVTLGSTPMFIRGPLSSLRISKIERHEFPVSDSPDNVRIRNPGAIAISQYITNPTADFWRIALAKKQAMFDRRLEIDLPAGQLERDGAVKARFACFNSSDMLYIAVNVEDRVHFQTRSGALTWQDDSLQIALQSHFSGFIAEDEKSTAITVALVNGKAEVYRYESEVGRPLGPDSRIKAEVIREGTSTFYLVGIPVEEIRQKEFLPASHLGFSLLVNNNDGNGRTWLGWGSEGIANGTNPQRYNWLTFSSNPSSQK